MTAALAPGSLSEAFWVQQAWQALGTEGQIETLARKGVITPEQKTIFLNAADKSKRQAYRELTGRDYVEDLGLAPSGYGADGKPILPGNIKNRLTLRENFADMQSRTEAFNAGSYNQAAFDQDIIAFHDRAAFIRNLDARANDVVNGLMKDLGLAAYELGKMHPAVGGLDTAYRTIRDGPSVDTILEVATFGKAGLIGRADDLVDARHAFSDLNISGREAIDFLSPANGRSVAAETAIPAASRELVPLATKSLGEWGEARLANYRWLGG